jgi:multidrug resistance protein
MSEPKRLSRPSSSASVTPSLSISWVENSVIDLPKDHSETRDVEAQSTTQEKAAHWELVFDQTHVTAAVLNNRYHGSGTEDNPFIVEYIPHDRRNPYDFPKWKKWMITVLSAFVCLYHRVSNQEASANRSKI